MSTALRHLARLALLPALLGCRGGEADRGRAASAEPLLVFAAADLQAAFAEMVPAWEAASGVRITLVLGSTGNLATQIEHGAPADLFFAASERFVDRLAAAGRIDEGTRRVYARGRLAVVWSGTDAPADLRELTLPRFGAIAIANPEHAPYGTAAREALSAAGIWEAVRPRLVVGESVAQALRFVRSGNADAGVVALGLVLAGGRGGHLIVPDSLHAPLRQEAAVVRDSRHADAARAFLAHVLSPEGQATLRRHGFEPPGP
jgi:molybdate transport system substrate-binding protein